MRAGLDVRDLSLLSVVFGRRRLEHRLDLVEGHAKHAVIVPEHQVARRDDHAADRDRHIDLARPVLVGAAMGDAGREHRKLLLADVGGVADRAVDDDPGEHRAW